MFQLGHPIFKLPLALGLLIFVLSLSSVTDQFHKTIDLTQKTVNETNALVLATDFVVHMSEAKKLNYQDISSFEPEFSRIPPNKRKNIFLVSKETYPGKLKETIAKAEELKRASKNNTKISHILEKISSTEVFEISDKKLQDSLMKQFKLPSIPTYLVANEQPISNTTIELNTIDSNLPKTEDEDFISKDKLNRFLIFLSLIIISNIFYFGWVKYFSEQQMDQNENKHLKKIIGMLLISLVVSYFNIHLVSVLATLKGWAFIGNAFAQGIGLYSAFFKV